jgi:hypothetical protein
LSAVIGSWKIMPTSLPRIRQSARFVEAGESLPSSPADRAAGRRAVRQQLHHGKRGHRLARPAFADDAETSPGSSVRSMSCNTVLP